MLKSERIAKRINEKIKVWLKSQDRLVVAIDGYSGSGKTTVTDFIAKQNHDVLAVHLDDFVKHWKVRKRLIEITKDKSKVFEHGWYRYGDLKKLIKAFKVKNRGWINLKTYDFKKNAFASPKPFDLSKKAIVIDGIFLFHLKHKIITSWDKRIYLEVDFNKADRKRIAREKKKWGKDYVPENHLDNWTKYYKIAYRRYVKRFKQQTKVDMVFKV